MTDKLFINFSNIQSSEVNDDASIIISAILSGDDKKQLLKTESDRCSKPFSGFLEMEIPAKANKVTIEVHRSAKLSILPKFIGRFSLEFTELPGLDQSFCQTVDLVDKSSSKTGIMDIRVTHIYLVPPNVTYNSYKNDIFKAIDTLDMALFLRSLETYDINEVDDKTGNTPLHAACAQSANENFAINLINDPRVIVYKKNIDGNTPLHILAKQFNNPNVQTILDGFIRKGGNINERNNQGESAIHRAVFNKTVRNTLIKCLTEKGVDINAVTKDRMSALHYAVQIKKVDTVMHLIACGINCNIENSKGETAMDMAIEQDSLVTVQAIRDSIDLLTYLKELGLDKFKETFIEKRMFKYSLKNIRKYMLGELGITDSDDIKKCMDHFPKIADPDRSSVYLALADTAKSEIGNTGVMITEAELTLGAELGEGSFAKVYRGTYTPKDGAATEGPLDVAVKVITVSGAAKNKAQLAQKVEEAKEEYAITCAVSCPNILRMIGWVDTVGPTSAPAIVMELCENKSLYDYLKSDVKITWAQAIQMFSEIAKGLDAIHSHIPQIIHRDLKSLNILVTKDVHLKLCDFGLARFNVEESNDALRKAKGTFRYMPPEVLGLQSLATAKSDIFALGIIFWEITFRTITKTYQLPYDEFGKMSDANLIEKINNKMHPTVPKATHPQIRNLVYSCLSYEPGLRPTASEIIDLIELLRFSYDENSILFERSIDNTTEEEKKSQKK